MALPACSDDTNEAIEDDLRSGAEEVGDAAEEVSEDTIELVARNIASTQGAQEFEAVGHPIEGDLTCVADAAADLTTVEVDCSGETQDGSTAELIGTTSELPGASITELEGEFIGFIGTEEVFRTDRLGG